MIGENNKKSIVDGLGTGLQASVVPLLSDPTKNGLVVVNPDGSKVGSGFLKLNQTTAQTTVGRFTFPSITVDTKTLYIDSVNHRVGVGTLTPRGAFEIYGDSLANVGSFLFDQPTAPNGSTAKGPHFFMKSAGIDRGWIGFFDSGVHGNGTQLNIKSAGQVGFTAGNVGTANQVTLVTSGNLLIGTTTDITDFGGAKLQVKGGASSGSNWSGRIVAGGSTSVFLMGELDSKAVLAGHTSNLQAWAPLYINPTANANTYIGNANNWGPTSVTTTTLSVIGAKVGISTHLPASKLHINSAPVASANYGTISLGSGAFDGSTSGKFVGNANGTSIAVNEVSGYTGELLNLQVNGISKFSISNTGITNLAEALNVTSNTSYINIGGTSFNNTQWSGSRMYFSRARGTSTTPLAVTNGDTIGWFDFFGHDGTALNVRAAQFNVVIDGTVATGKVPSKFVFSTADANGVTTSRLQLYANDNIAGCVYGGRFLIGTTTDNTLDKLQVAGSSKFGLNTTDYARIQSDGKLIFNGTARKKWVKYTANSVTLTNGTSANTVSNLQTMTDGSYYTVTEASGVPGIGLIVDFVSVTAFSMCRVLGGYVGSSTHAIAIQVYNRTTSAWDTFNAIQNGFYGTTAGNVVLENCEFNVYDDTNYIGTSANAGNVRIRFNHPMSGNPAHQMILDEVSLRQ